MLIRLKYVERNVFTSLSTIPDNGSDQIAAQSNKASTFRVRCYQHRTCCHPKALLPLFQEARQGFYPGLCVYSTRRERRVLEILQGYEGMLLFLRQSHLTNMLHLLGPDGVHQCSLQPG